LDINAATVSEWIQGSWNELSKVIVDPTCFVRPLGLKALLEIELSQERRTVIERADEVTLRAWVDHLKTHRQWPGGDKLS
jgi:hypothetical protein